MIPGIVAASGAGSGNANPYPGSIAVADFLGGQYFIGGNAVAASSIIDRSDLVDGAGLTLDWNIRDEYARIQGDFLAALVTGNWTIVVETEETGSGDMYPLTLWETDTGSGPGQAFFLFFGDNSTGQISDFMAGSGAARNLSRSASARPAVRKWACTRTDAKAVLSVNGSAITSNTTPKGSSICDEGYLGLWTPNDSFSTFNGSIRRVIVYDPVSDAELPALSA
jgi:hypothetical protein